MAGTLSTWQGQSGYWVTNLPPFVADGQARRWKNAIIRKDVLPAATRLPDSGVSM